MTEDPPDTGDPEIKGFKSHYDSPETPLRLARPVGRPPKYRPHYCDIAIALGRQGKSLYEIASHLDVARSTLDNWGETYPEFLDALMHSQAHAQAWWEETGRAALTAQHFQGAVWSKTMAARFRHDYTERQTTDIRYQGGVEVRHKVENTSPRQIARAVLSLIEEGAAEAVAEEIAVEETNDVD